MPKNWPHSVLIAAVMRNVDVAACSGGNMYATSNGAPPSRITMITIGSVTTNSVQPQPMAGRSERVQTGGQNQRRWGIFGKQKKLESMDDKGDVIEGHPTPLTVWLATRT